MVQGADRWRSTPQKYNRSFQFLDLLRCEPVDPAIYFVFV